MDAIKKQKTEKEERRILEVLEYRRKYNASCRDVAAKFGMSKDTVNRWAENYSLAALQDKYRHVINEEVQQKVESRQPVAKLSDTAEQALEAAVIEVSDLTIQATRFLKDWVANLQTQLDNSKKIPAAFVGLAVQIIQTKSSLPIAPRKAEDGKKKSSSNLDALRKEIAERQQAIGSISKEVKTTAKLN
jgi:transposase